MEHGFTRLGRDELFDRLGEGAPAGATVVTPNRRLAEALTAEFDARQQGGGLASWEAPDILPWETFLARCHDEALYADPTRPLPTLLGEAEEQLLWEEAIRAGGWRDRLLSVGATASLAASAWRLLHAWRIDGALASWPGNEDSEAFRSWIAHYVRRTARDRLVEGARLPGEIEALFPARALEPPRLLVIYGFDLVTPQQHDVLRAMQHAGTSVLASGPDAIGGAVRRAELDSPREELEHAARWARARLEQRAGEALPRIAVVVPDLATRRAEVARVFARVLPAELFNVSLGAPLDGMPLADAALGLLELASGPVTFERASRLLRSPFVAGAERELTARAALDAALRRSAPATVTIARLRALVSDALARPGAAPCPRLCAFLDAMMAAAGEMRRAAPHEWARRFTAWLDAAGFPGERALDSAEYQTLAKWREAIATLAALGSVAGTWGAGEARARLARLARDTLFQPASGRAPVQVLGILESSRLAFDHLWVSGLTEDAWPLPVRPQPLVPPALQRKAGVPQASPERSLALDREFTQAWREAAAEVIFSSARADGDRELLASPLVAAIDVTPVADLGIPHFATRRDALFAAGRREGAMREVAERQAPAVDSTTVRGGTGILADQAACPFRAFAHYRLRAERLERPEAGLTPPERGQLLHALMAHLWERLRDHRTLCAMPPAELATSVDEAAAKAVSRLRSQRPGRLEGELATLERERLAALARQWLEIERTRPPFEVVACEQKLPLAAGRLRSEGRADRLDRIEGAGLAILDYKSGAATPSAWFGARPDDVQLPLYALASGADEVCAVAFAKLKAGELGFSGVAREGGLLPRVAAVEETRAAKGLVASWAELVQAWRRESAALGDAFMDGAARIDPKDGLATCRRCDLAPLCRVHERLDALAGESAAEAAE